MVSQMARIYGAHETIIAAFRPNGRSHRRADMCAYLAAYMVSRIIGHVDLGIFCQWFPHFVTGFSISAAYMVSRIVDQVDPGINRGDFFVSGFPISSLVSRRCVSIYGVNWVVSTFREEC